MTDRLIKGERDRTIVAENNRVCVCVWLQVNREMERCHRGGRSWERERSAEMDWWRPERDRKWIYIHNSFCAPFDFWKGSRCVSQHTAATIVAQWFTGSQMNMEQARFATLAGSFPTERHSVNPSLLHCYDSRGGGEGMREGLRDRMKNVMTATKWQKEGNTTGCVCWVCFLLLRSPRFRGMPEIMWSSARHKVSGLHESCIVNRWLNVTWDDGRHESFIHRFTYKRSTPPSAPPISGCMETAAIQQQETLPRKQNADVRCRRPR